MDFWYEFDEFFQFSTGAQLEEYFDKIGVVDD